MHVESLRRALADSLGQTLTPELCASIENRARVTPDESIDLSMFEPMVLDDGYVIACERFESCLGELHALHEAHWHETEGYRHGLALRPNYAAMVAFERAGQMLQVTVRHEAKLVGSIRMYVTRSFHTDDMLASEDSLFLLPAHRARSTWLALRMLRYTVQCLETLRDHRGEPRIAIEASSKLSNRADALMRRLFGAPVAAAFHRVFHAGSQHAV